MAAKKKPAAKPTRWWACVDKTGQLPPTILASRRDARDQRDYDSGYVDDHDRFVVRRVEIREV